jgi:hypothetical protein
VMREGGDTAGVGDEAGNDVVGSRRKGPFQSLQLGGGASMS